MALTCGRVGQQGAPECNPTYIIRVYILSEYELNARPFESDWV